MGDLAEWRAALAPPLADAATFEAVEVVLGPRDRLAALLGRASHGHAAGDEIAITHHSIEPHRTPQQERNPHRVAVGDIDRVGGALLRSHRPQGAPLGGGSLRALG